MSAYFETFKLGKTYKTPKGDAVIVKNFNLKMKKGEFVCVIGHSGCGKSTVLSMVAGLNEITEGGVILDGNEISGAAPDRGVVFQSPCLLPWMSAWDNVMLGVNQVYYHASRAERNQIVEYYLTAVGLSGSFNKRPDELSGGMRQRVGLARAFALSPKMLLLDEPFADRVIMMTNGPAAGIGDILEINLPRPRDRQEIMSQEQYYDYREFLLNFLQERADEGREERSAA